MARLGGGLRASAGRVRRPSRAGSGSLAIALSPDGSRIARTEVDGATPERGGRARRARPVGRRRRRDPRARPPVKPLAGRTVLVTRPRPRRDARAAARAAGRHRDRGPGDRARARSGRPRSRGRSRELADGAFAWVTLTSPRTVDVLAEHLTAGPRPGQGRRGGRRDGRTVPTVEPARPRPRAEGVHDRRARPRVPPGRAAACSCRAPTSRPRGSRTRSPQGVDARRASTPTGRGCPARSPPRHARRSARATSTPSRSRAPPRCAGSCARWAW